MERKVNRCRIRATIAQFADISLVTGIYLTITGFEEQAFVVLQRDAPVSVTVSTSRICVVHAGVFRAAHRRYPLLGCEENRLALPGATRVDSNEVTNLISGVKIPVLLRTSIVTPHVQNEPQPKGWYTKQ